MADASDTTATPATQRRPSRRAALSALAAADEGAGMPFPIAPNPCRLDLLWLAGPGGAIRAIRDPASGACFAWKPADARHAEVAARLGLDFRTRQDLRRHSFIIGYDQVQDIDGPDLAGIIRRIEGG